MPLSVDMREKRVMSDSRRSLKVSPNSKYSCSWLRENDSDVELDRNHLDRIRPVGSVNSDTVRRLCRSQTPPPRPGGPLTDVKTLRPHVEAHLWIGKGAVAQRPTGKGFCCIHTGRGGRKHRGDQKHHSAVSNASKLPLRAQRWPIYPPVSFRTSKVPVIGINIRRNGKNRRQSGRERAKERGGQTLLSMSRC